METVYKVSFIEFSIHEVNVLMKSEKNVWLMGVGLGSLKEPRKLQYRVYCNTLKEAKEILANQMQNSITNYDTCPILKACKRNNKEFRKELKRKLKYLNLLIP